MQMSILEFFSLLHVFVFSSAAGRFSFGGGVGFLGEALIPPVLRAKLR